MTQTGFAVGVIGLVIVGGVGLVIGIGLWVGGGGRWIYSVWTWVLCWMRRRCGLQRGLKGEEKSEPWT